MCGIIPNMKNLIHILFVLGLVSCSSMSHKAPSLSFVNLNVEKVALLESDVRVHYRLSNEEAKSIDYSGASFKLYLNDEYVGKGVNKSRIKLSPLEEKDGSVIIHVSNISLVSEIQPLIGSGKFKYRLEGRFISPGLIDSVYSDDEGGFTLPGT